jgi:lysophospholipid acyltransferase (LPLAT)-like uncharacterized protein
VPDPNRQAPVAGPQIRDPASVAPDPRSPAPGSDSDAPTAHPTSGPGDPQAARAGPQSPDWRTSRAKQLQVAVIPALAYPFIKALGATYRWRQEGDSYYQDVLRSGRQPIMAFWHGRILPATLYFQHRGIVVITSENFDGEWIARIIHRFGYGSARGSSSRGAVRALVQLKKLMAAGKPAAFTLDGPRGPARVAQPGAVFLSSVTGNPIIPFHIESDRHWTMRSWDRTQVPKPWSRVGIAIGAPFVVPPETGEEGLEAARQDLERRLASLENRARELLRPVTRA